MRRRTLLQASLGFAICATPGAAAALFWAIFPPCNCVCPPPCPVIDTSRLSINSAILTALRAATGQISSTEAIYGVMGQALRPRALGLADSGTLANLGHLHLTSLRYDGYNPLYASLPLDGRTLEAAMGLQPLPGGLRASDLLASSYHPTALANTLLLTAGRSLPGDMANAPYLLGPYVAQASTLSSRDMAAIALVNAGGPALQQAAGSLLPGQLSTMATQVARTAAYGAPIDRNAAIALALSQAAPDVVDRYAYGLGSAGITYALTAPSHGGLPQQLVSIASQLPAVAPYTRYAGYGGYPTSPAQLLQSAAAGAGLPPEYATLARLAAPGAANLGPLALYPAAQAALSNATSPLLTARSETLGLSGQDIANALLMSATFGVPPTSALYFAANPTSLTSRLAGLPGLSTYAGGTDLAAVSHALGLPFPDAASLLRDPLSAAQQSAWLTSRSTRLPELQSTIESQYWLDDETNAARAAVMHRRSQQTSASALDAAAGAYGARTRSAAVYRANRALATRQPTSPPTFSDSWGYHTAYRGSATEAQRAILFTLSSSASRTAAAAIQQTPIERAAAAQIAPPATLDTSPQAVAAVATEISGLEALLSQATTAAGRNALVIQQQTSRNDVIAPAAALPSAIASLQQYQSQLLDALPGRGQDLLAAAGTPVGWTDTVARNHAAAAYGAMAETTYSPFLRLVPSNPADPDSDLVTIAIDLAGTASSFYEALSYVQHLQAEAAGTDQALTADNESRPDPSTDPAGTAAYVRQRAAAIAADPSLPAHLREQAETLAADAAVFDPVPPAGPTAAEWEAARRAPGTP